MYVLHIGNNTSGIHYENITGEIASKARFSNWLNSRNDLIKTINSQYIPSLAIHRKRIKLQNCVVKPGDSSDKNEIIAYNADETISNPWVMRYYDMSLLYTKNVARGPGFHDI
jgi:hypothetical protein